MNKAFQQAVKDEENEHPVASAWRETLRRIVSALAEGDYRLALAPEGVEFVNDATAKQIADYVADYGERLVELPDEAWDSSVARWMGSHWDVLIDLWTRAEGRSDLVLQARVYETEGGYRYEVGLVYVP